MPILRFLPEATNINFVGARYFAFALDGLLLLVSLVSIVWYGFNLGIDFTGGVLLEVKSAQIIDIGKMRSEVSSLGFADSQIQYFGGGECDKPVSSCVLIRVKPRCRSARSDRRAYDQGQARQRVQFPPCRSRRPQSEPGIVPRRRYRDAACDSCDCGLGDSVRASNGNMA